MDESTSQIEKEIRKERHELGHHLNELEMKAKQLADWRTYYRNNPKLLLGLALGSGLVLGAITAGSRFSENTDDRESDRTVEPPLALTPFGRQVQDTWQTMADALLGVASAKVMQFVGNIVPGFKEQLEQRTGPH